MKTNDECLKNFIGDYNIRLAETTLDYYQFSIRKLLVHCEKPIAEITSKDIRGWVQQLETRYKPETVRTRLKGLRLFFKYCLEEEIITYNPMASVPSPKIEENLPHYLLNEQLAELRKLVEGRLEERAVIEVLYATGIRISELAALKKEDVDWPERIIYVRNGKRKKDRIVLFTRPCEELLKAYLKERQDNLPFVFVNSTGTGPIYVGTIRWRFQKYTRNLGIRMSPHTLRHTFAAHLAMKGMPLSGIQELLGHVEPKNSQVYTRLFDHARKQMYDQWM